MKHFIEEANALKEATNGVINMFKTGRISKTAQTLFYQFVRTLKVDHIYFEEAKFIHWASSGSIMYAEKYKGPAYCYDFVSHYPFLMQDHHMLFPIKEGKLMILTQKEFKSKKFVSYGIYRCKIRPSEDLNKNKLFRFSRNNYYTQIDINLAIEFKFEIEMIEDDKPNMLYYSRECLIQGHILFKPFVDYMFDLKQKKVPGSKKVENALWGVLSKCDKMKVTFDLTKGFELHKGKEYIELTPSGNRNGNIMKATIVSKDNFFDTDFARIKPFVLAKGRYILKKKALPFIKNIKYMHTDSMITDIKLNIETGDDLGELQYKGSNENINIVNINKKLGPDGKKAIFS